MSSTRQFGPGDGGQARKASAESKGPHLPTRCSDQAAGAIETLGRQKALGGRESRNIEAEGSQEIGQGFADRLVIVDDRNHSPDRHYALLSTRSGGVAALSRRRHAID